MGALFELADAPNHRRLFRESEQVFRVLNAAARITLKSLAALGRPLLLRNAGAADLVSLRGLMHTVECSRFADVRASVQLCDWSATPRYASSVFAARRAAQHDSIVRRMRATVTGDSASSRPVDTDVETAGLEHDYLAVVVDEGACAARRVAAALLAIRACFFTTNYEGTFLAAETALDLLARPGDPLTADAVRAEWDSLDHPLFDVPMIELDRTSIGDSDHLRALLTLHVATT